MSATASSLTPPEPQNHLQTLFGAALSLDLLCKDEGPASSSEPAVPTSSPLRDNEPPTKRQRTSKITFDGCVTWRDAIVCVLSAYPYPLEMQFITDFLVEHRFSKTQGRSPSEIRNLVSGVIRSDISRNPAGTAFSKTPEGLYILRDPSQPAMLTSTREEQLNRQTPADAQSDDPDFEPQYGLMAPQQDSESHSFHSSSHHHHEEESGDHQWVAEDGHHQQSYPAEQEHELSNAPSDLTWKDSILMVMRERGCPLDVSEIAAELIRRDLNQGKAQSELGTHVSSIISINIFRHPDKTPFKKVSHGRYALKETQSTSSDPHYLSWKDAIFMVLRERSVPLRPREIAEEMKTRGWTVADSTMLANVICTILSREVRKNPTSGMFIKMSYGQYAANLNHPDADLDFGANPSSSRGRRPAPDSRARTTRQTSAPKRRSTRSSAKKQRAAASVDSFDETGFAQDVGDDEWQGSPLLTTPSEGFVVGGNGHGPKGRGVKSELGHKSVATNGGHSHETPTQEVPQYWGHTEPVQFPSLPDYQCAPSAGVPPISDHVIPPLRAPSTFHPTKIPLPMDTSFAFRAYPQPDISNLVEFGYFNPHFPAVPSSPFGLEAPSPYFFSAGVASQETAKFENLPGRLVSPSYLPSCDQLVPRLQSISTLSPRPIRPDPRDQCVVPSLPAKPTGSMQRLPSIRELMVPTMLQ